MPKRARCPYCDRLFIRDRLDDHILRCKERKRGEKKVLQRIRKLVVDGNNVAFHLVPQGKPRAANLMNAYHSLVSAGYRPIFVVSAALKYRIDRPTVLQDLAIRGKVIESPSGKNDDLVILQTAKRLGADIVSNDRFLDWLDSYPWVPTRLRRYRLTPSGLILD